MTRTSRLRQIGVLFGLGDALVRAAELLVDEGEPYELGLALSVSGDRRGVLLSYNPRTRARARMLRALAAHGLPVAPVRAAFSWVAEDRCSSVLGLEWVGGGAVEDGVEATVYLEELARFWDAVGVQRLTERVARAVDQPVPDWGDDPGHPYILALDLEPDGVVALKTYRWTASVPDDLAALFPGEEAASGWILQRKHPGVRTSDFRFSRRTAPPLKVYKTFAYETGAGGEAAVAELCSLLGAEEPVVQAMAGVPMTSIGLRLGDRGVETVTGYWCLERGGGQRPRITHNE